MTQNAKIYEEKTTVEFVRNVAYVAAQVTGVPQLQRYERPFTQSDLTDHKLAVSHGLSAPDKTVVIAIQDSNGFSISPTNIEFKTGDLVEIDLRGYTPITGQWSVAVI